MQSHDQNSTSSLISETIHERYVACVITNRILSTRSIKIGSSFIFFPGHFQPTDGRLTKTIYPDDDITLSVSTTDTYTAGEDEIRWRTFSNLAEGSLSPEGDGALTYTIRSATKRNADIYGAVKNDMIENLMYSLIRVIVSGKKRFRFFHSVVLII